MNETFLRQFDLYQHATHTHMITWLEEMPGLHVGSTVTLEELPGVWTVMHAYRTKRTAHDLNTTRRWKVGGLE